MIKKVLSGILAVVMVASMIPLTASAATSSNGSVVADGTYTATGTSSYKKDGETYKATVTVTVANGKISSLSATGPTTSDNKSYFQKALTGITSKLVGQNATSNAADNIDAVTKATNSSKLIKEAIGIALKNAPSGDTDKPSTDTDKPSSDTDTPSTDSDSSYSTGADYVLVKTPQNGKKYIICDEDGKDDKDKDGYVLTGTGGTAEIKVKSSNSNKYGATYIKADDEANVFTFTGSVSSFTLKNNKGQFLTFNGNKKTPTTSSTGTNFQYENNKYFKYGSFYLVEKDNQFTLRNDKDDKIYFFEQVASSVPKTYTVTWKNYDGSVLKTDSNVTNGTKPTYNGSTPTRAATAQYTYSFNGWSTSMNQTKGTAISNLPAVSGNVTYYAAFAETIRSYPITWKNWDGSVLKTNTVDYGVIPSYDGIPTRPANGSKTYTFSGWSPTVSKVTESAVYTATFSENVPKVSDGTYGDNSTEVEDFGYTPIVSVTVENGIITELNADAETEELNRGFLQTALEGLRDKLLNKSVSAVDSVDAVTGATYASDAIIYDIKKALNEAPKGPYTIQWKNYDGSEWRTDTNVKYGSRTSYDDLENPTRSDDDKYSYSFKGWTPTVSTFVTSDSVYTAEYDSTKKADPVYTLSIGNQITYDTSTGTFTGADSRSKYDSETNTISVYPTDIIFTIDGKESAARVTNVRGLRFISEDDSIAESKTEDDLWFKLTGNSGNTTVTAQVFDLSTGKTLAEAPIIVTVSAPQVLTADGKYTDGTQSVERFGYTPIVTLIVEDGKITSVEVAARNITERNSSFLNNAAEWLKNGLTGKAANENSVNEIDAQTGATYSKNALRESAKKALSAENKITWINYDGTILDFVNVTTGTFPTYDGDTPIKENTAEYTYTFKDWSPEVSAVTGDAEYTAQFESAVNDYTLTLKNSDDTVIDTITAAYGTSVTIPETSAKEGYTFVGWNTEKNSTTAQYHSGDKYTLNDDVVLYAIWKVNASPLSNNSTLSAETINLGDKVTINGAAAGGTAPYYYGYYYKKSNTSNWTKLGTGATANFTPTQSGTYNIKVNVMDSEGKIAAKTFTLTVIGKVLENTSTISESTVNAGEKLTLNGTATGGTAPYYYGYYYKKSNTSNWTKLGTGATASFIPTQSGTYDVKVNVMDGESKIVVKTFTVTVIGESIPLENTSTISAATVNVGGKLTIKGSATGGSTPYNYGYYYKTSTASKWTKLGIGDSASFVPTASATYSIKVNVMDGDGTIAVKTFTVKVN